MGVPCVRVQICRLLAPAGFWRTKKKVPKVVFLVFWCLIYMQERREMGQTALETTLNELKHVLLLPFFLLPVTSSMI